jgi:quinol monooxygenase YgiN
VAPTRAEAGCVNYDFHVDVEDPKVFVFDETGEAATISTPI